MNRVAETKFRTKTRTTNRRLGPRTDGPRTLHAPQGSHQRSAEEFLWNPFQRGEQAHHLIHDGGSRVESHANDLFLIVLAPEPKLPEYQRWHERQSPVGPFFHRKIVGSHNFAKCLDGIAPYVARCLVIGRKSPLTGRHIDQQAPRWGKMKKQGLQETGFIRDMLQNIEEKD